MLDKSREIRFSSKKFGNVVELKAIPGHFATNHSHINYYIDLTTMKSRMTEARSAARALALQYVNDTVVDTIVCLDGTNVIGAYLAEELNAAGFSSINAHGSIYVTEPEYVTSSQMIFRDNVAPMIKGKNVILLMASVSTGESVKRGATLVDYYGGKLQGISCMFSAINQIQVSLQNGRRTLPINSIYSPEDITGYTSFDSDSCPFCKKGIRVEALVNSFGYSEFMY